MTRDVHCLMRSGSGGVPTRQRGAPKRPAVLGWVAAAHSDFLRFAVEPYLPLLEKLRSLGWVALSDKVYKKNGVVHFRQKLVDPDSEETWDIP